MSAAIVRSDKINVTILPRVPLSLPLFFKYRAADRDGRCDSDRGDRFSVRSWIAYLISSVFRELRPLNAF